MIGQARPTSGTGRGGDHGGDGWGNNELEHSRAENAGVEGGNPIVAARPERYQSCVSHPRVSRRRAARRGAAVVVVVGGNRPGRPDATTVFPQPMLVDCVRVYEKTP